MNEYVANKAAYVKDLSHSPHPVLLHHHRHLHHIMTIRTLAPIRKSHPSPRPTTRWLWMITAPHRLLKTSMNIYAPFHQIITTIRTVKRTYTLCLMITMNSNTTVSKRCVMNTKMNDQFTLISLSIITVTVTLMYRSTIRVRFHLQWVIFYLASRHNKQGQILNVTTLRRHNLSYPYLILTHSSITIITNNNNSSMAKMLPIHCPIDKYHHFHLVILWM